MKIEKIIKNEEKYVCAIRRQLESQYETELNRAQQREVDHRKEIVRILSTHEVSLLYNSEKRQNSDRTYRDEK